LLKISRRTRRASKQPRCQTKTKRIVRRLKRPTDLLNWYPVNIVTSYLWRRVKHFWIAHSQDCECYTGIGRTFSYLLWHDYLNKCSAECSIANSCDKYWTSRKKKKKRKEKRKEVQVRERKIDLSFDIVSNIARGREPSTCAPDIVLQRKHPRRILPRVSRKRAGAHERSSIVPPPPVTFYYDGAMAAADACWCPAWCRRKGASFGTHLPRTLSRRCRGLPGRSAPSLRTASFRAILNGSFSHRFRRPSV